MTILCNDSLTRRAAGDNIPCMEPSITDLLNKTMVRVEQTTDARGEDALVMETDDGMVYTFAHSRDCCESVTINDITGDLSNLVGSPITLAEESSQDGREAGLAFPSEYTPDSSTWTFYKFATIKGYVDVRFFGESNGYYSEGVYLSVKRKKAA